ncbi:hypothetical protein [Phytoactinopolyspora endophytica]|uniref:hypothetical protein n=1 Tax=Phytoactinopolyspora endophytica TaxID=1642495 RepID=UPI0013EC1EE9|nr:hypothetical protein [Phytoactinopolyspora endophytica]
MADPSPTDDTGPEPGRPTPPRMPGWVKVSGAVLILVIVAIVLVMVLGDGDHEPGRHG